jgi:CHAT domain-containing protein
MRFPSRQIVLMRVIRRRRPHPLLAFFLLLFCLALSLLTACRTQTSEDCLSHPENGVELKLGRPIQRDLRGGETQCYRVVLTPQQYLHFIVNQMGIDVVVTVFDPGSKEITRIDRPNGSRGLEGVSIVSRQGGDYILQIRSLEPAVNAAQYTIAVDEVRSIRPDDENRVSAEQTVSEGERLRASGVAANLPPAIDNFKKSLKLWRDLKDRYEECVALYGVALAHRTANENQDAITAFEEGRLIAHELGDPYMEGISLVGAGWSLIYVGDTHQALTRFSTAEDLLRSIKDRRGEGVCLYGIGWVHALDGEDEQALEQFKQSLQIRRETKDRRGEALTLTGMGKILGRMNRNDEALADLTEALELLNNSKGDARADALSATGWVYSSMSQIDNAVSCFQQALQIWSVLGDQTGEATSLFGLAKTEAQRDELLSAEEHMQRALSIVELMRTKGENEKLRTSYFALVQDYFDFTIDLLMRLDRRDPGKGYAAKAFEISERSRSRKLLDLLTEAQADLRLGIDRELLEQERAFSKELNAASSAQRSLLTQQFTPEQATAAARRVDDLTAQLEEVEAKIRRLSPQYALLTQARPMSAAEVQKTLLDDDSMLLEYSLGKERSYLWAISRDEIDSYELPPGSQIDEMAYRLYELLTARNTDVDGETITKKNERVSRADAASPTAAMNLSRIILGPVASRLGSKRLIIVSQSALGVIPFSALPVPVSAAGLPVTQLLLNHEIVNVPSASSLAVVRQLQSKRPRPPHAIAIIADPVFQKDDERFQVSSTGNQSDPGKSSIEVGSYSSGSNDPSKVTDDVPERISRLFATRWEAREIAALVPGSQRTLALDFTANEDFVTHSDLAQYRIIHFATHTFIDYQHPELSRIALSGYDAHGNKIDGFLYAHEIYRLRLPVELVVLSSCRSAQASEVKGEGLVAFAHAFMYAGAPRVLATLWGVDDTSTSEFMVRYYRRMLGRQHLSPAAALRATQLEFVHDQRWQSPYFWSAFVLQGEW